MKAKLWRGMTLAAAATAALAGTATAASNPPTTSAFDLDGRVGTLAAGLDGSTWAVERTDLAEVSFTRYGSSGELSSVPLNRPLDEFHTAPKPLADGGMGAIVASMERNYPPVAGYVALARANAAGTVVRLTPLPAAARRAEGFAIEGDGTVWFARGCADAIYRWLPNRKLTRFQLRRVGCVNDSSESRSALSVGVDGSAWFVNLEQRRIARVDARGRVREWRVPLSRDPDGQPLRLAADPRGGLAFSDEGYWGTRGVVAGRVTSAGTLLMWEETGVPAFGADGTLWQTTSRGLARTGRDGDRWDVALPGAPETATSQTFALALARDGTPWFLAGSYESPPSRDGYYEQLSFGSVPFGIDGAAELPADAVSGLATHREERIGDLVLGGDGAFWSYLTTGERQGQLVRLLPPGVGDPRRPMASARRVLARDGRTVVLQLSCDADRGRLCHGTVRLAKAAARTPFVVEGQSRAAVRLTLEKRASDALRRRGALRTTAIVRGDGAGETRRALRLRR